MTDSLSDIRSECSRTEYERKYMHAVPDALVIDRASFIVDQCRGRVVLSLGASGPLQDQIDDVAQKCYTVDIEPQPGRPNFTQMDLDDISERNQLPFVRTVQVVLMGEVLEHLTNPGKLLRTIKAYYPDDLKLITVPNAFAAIGHGHIVNGYENVNADHVAWYSYHTLKRLVEKTGLTIEQWYWYNGKPLTAEGLIFVVR